MILPAPRFDLAKERTGVLWLGLVFFLLLALLLIFAAVLPDLPWLAPAEPAPTEQEKRLAQEGIGLPSTEGIRKRAAAERKEHELISLLISAAALLIVTVLPIARQLRRRRRAGRAPSLTAPVPPP